MAIGQLSPEDIKSRLNTRLMGRAIHYFETIPTTMDEADRLAAQGSPEGTIVLADEQTAGRGRFSRKWFTPRGSTVAVSIILRPTDWAYARLGMAASLAVVKSIEKVAGLRPRIKWPNDVLVRGKKTSGILITSRFEDGRLDFVDLGIGINTNLPTDIVTKISPPATSLSAELGREVSRLEVLCVMLEELEEQYGKLQEGKGLLEEWRPYLETLGKRVRVQWRREDLAGYQEEGVAQDVDDEGHLLLKVGDGSLKVLEAGEVTLHL